MTIYKHNIIWGAIALTLLAGGCSDSLTDDAGSPDGKPVLRLSANIDQLNPTRANDSGFSDGDQIGIYVVSYNGNTPGVLKPEDNVASNVRHTFNEAEYSWTGERQIYYPDGETHVDVFGVYPYQDNINNVDEFPFSVEHLQNTVVDGQMSPYEKSDFLWGKTGDVAPGNGVVNVTFSHMMAGVMVTLIEGDGFAENEWSGLDKSVFIGSTVKDCKINLSTGDVTPEGEDDGKLIAASVQGDSFRAVVVPQTVAPGSPLIIIKAGEQSYKLAKPEEMTFNPSKLHKFTIEVNKNPDGAYEFSLIHEAITPWESDRVSHNGETKEYVTVNVAEYGSLEKALSEAGLTPKRVVNLKLTGFLNENDFHYLRSNLENLEAVNLREATVTGTIWSKAEHLTATEVELMEKYNHKEGTLPEDAFAGLVYLRHVVLPTGLKAIGNTAFQFTALSGSLNLPDGLEFIGDTAFGLAYSEPNRKSINGELRLPESLKYIWDGAFYSLDISGELHLPEGLKYIGDGAFSRCEQLEGELHLPDRLEYLGSDAFFRIINLTGEIVYNHSDKVVRPLAGQTSIYGVRLPEAPTEFADGALRAVPLRGDLTIPATVEKFGTEALRSTKLSHIYFPKGLNVDYIPESFMRDNRELIDTVTFPEKVEIIGVSALSGCEKLDAIVIPKSVIRIRDWAFSGCSSLTYIRCDAVAPPEVPENAFEGINKDNFTLEVPQQSVDAYRNAPGWKEFRRIAAYSNFVARPMKYNLLNKGGERDVILNADGEWDITEIPSWCHIDKTSGNLKTQLKLTVDPMGHGSGDREGKIVFRLKNSDDITTAVTVGQYDYEHEEDSFVALNTATTGSGVNLFLVGDGYDALDISSGKMLADMKEEMEYLFAVEPFATYRDRFNVYCGVALSDDSGVEDVNHWRKTKFHTTISNSNTRLEADYQSALGYALDICAPLSANGKENQFGVILVANSPIYEGVTYSSGDVFCAVVTRSENDYPYDARGLVQHEAGGHGIGWLADEYVYHNTFIQRCSCVCCKHIGDLQLIQADGYGLNVSLNGKFREVPWNHLMTNPTYSDIVDVYEGGYFHGKGVYRSEYNSCMNNNVPYYSTWSRQLIVERIMKLSGETFTLDKFLANDKRGQATLFNISTRGNSTALTPRFHGRPPVFIKNLEIKRKGGKK